MNPARKASTGLKSLLIWCFCLSCLSFLLLVISLASPNWLETRDGNRFFQKAGLWVFCFRHLPDPKFRFPTIIDGCRHVFNENLWHIRDVFLPRFLQTVQATMTIGFLLCTGATVAFTVFCTKRRSSLLWVFVIAFLHLAGGFWTTVGVLIFAVRGDGRDWMPDWRRNYLSWGFATAVGATVTQYCVAIMLTAYGVQRQKERTDSRSAKRPLPARPALRKVRAMSYDSENELRPLRRSPPATSPRTAKRVRFESRFDRERRLLLRERPVAHAGFTDI